MTHLILFKDNNKLMLTTPEGEAEFKLYPKRYFIVFLFSLIQFMTALLVNTLTPIASYLAIIYQQESTVINLGSLLFILMHPIFTFPASYVIDTFGARVGITVGSLLCLFGMGIRLLVNSGFFFVILGQIVAGIGRPFILNCQTKIAGNWFDAQSRGGVTQLLTLILNVSLIIGIFIPGLVYGDYKPDVSNPQSIEEGRDVTFKVMLVELIMGIFCYVPNILFQEDKPPTPPSDSVLAPRDQFKVAIPKLFANKNYILVWVTFGLYFGIFNGLSVILAFLLEPWFGGDDLPFAVACVGGAPVISGIIGVIVFGYLQRKNGDYKRWIIMCMIGSCISDIIFYPLLQTNSLFWASFVSALNSFFLIPLVPFMLQLSCQIAFPVGEGTAAGFLFANGNFGGFVLGTCLSLIVQGESKGQSVGGLGFCLGIFVIGLILTCLMQQQKNRSNYQKEASERRRTNSSSSNKSQKSDASRGQSDYKPVEIANGANQIEVGLLGRQGSEITQSLL